MSIPRVYGVCKTDDNRWAATVNDAKISTHASRSEALTAMRRLAGVPS